MKHLLILTLFIVVVVTGCHRVMIAMPGKSYRGALPPMSPDQKALSEAMRRDLNVLAGTIGTRSVFTPKKLAEAADFVEKGLARSGLEVRRQTFTAMRVNCANLEVEVPGKTLKDEIVVVGAHYDSGDETPGANDNGSGVVALLALAERLAKSAPARTLRLVAFVNEESPFFQTTNMGSWVYARAAHARGDKIVGMISLETMGYYSDAPGSQQYPVRMLSLFYPSRGNFVSFVGNGESKKFVRECIGVFRKETPFPSEGAALPSNLHGVGWSDQWAFWQEGYPGMMVTDTAPFRYQHYHTAEDTPDKVDYDRLARVTEGLDKVIRHLLNPGN